MILLGKRWEFEWKSWNGIQLPHADPDKKNSKLSDLKGGVFFSSFAKRRTSEI